MSKEAEILRKCVSCHDEHMCQKSRKSRGSCILGVPVLQKVTLKHKNMTNVVCFHGQHFSCLEDI